MKELLLLLLTSQLFIGLNAQLPCEYPGENDRWETRFKAPGASGGTIRALVSGDDGYLYLGGDYSMSYGGDTEYNNAVRFDGEKYEELGQGFTCTSCGTGYIEAMTKDNDGNIYIAGFFDGAKNNDGSIVPVRNIVKWNIQTESWEALGLGLGINKVYTLKWHNDTIYAGGEFDFAYNLTDTIEVNNIALFSTISNKWDSLGAGTSFSYPSTGDAVNTIDVTDEGTVLVGGRFNHAGGLEVNSVARWSPTSGWDDWNGGLVGYSVLTDEVWPAVAYAIQYISANGDVYATGTFGNYTASSSVVDVRQFAKWDGVTWSLVSGFGKPFNGAAWNIRALYFDDANSELYIGGTFNKYAPTEPLNNPVANRIVKYNINTETYTELNSGILNGNGPYAITQWNGKVWAAGHFNDMGNTYGSGLGSFDGVIWDNIGDGMSGYHSPKSISAHGSDIYVGGEFDRVDSLATDYLVKWNDASGWTDIDLGLLSGAASAYNKIIFETKVIGSKLWFGGMFTGVNETLNSHGIGTYDLNTGLVEGFGSGVDGSTARVFAIEEFQGDVYVGGSFTSIDGVTANRLAKYSGGVWTGIAEFFGDVYALENVGDSLLIIGGSFYKVGTDATQRRIVAWTGTSLQNVGNGFAGGTVYALESDDNGLLHIGGTFFNPQQSDGTYLSEYNHYLIQYYDGLFVDSTDFDITGKVLSLQSDANGVLYFAGEFTNPNGLVLNSIGRWSSQHGLMGFGTGVTNSYGFGDDITEVALVDSFIYTIGSHRRLGNSQSAGFGRYLLEDIIPGVEEFAFADTISGCDSVIINANRPDQLVIWSTGDTTQSLTIFTSGTYNVSASNEYGCTVLDSFYVDVFVSPDLTYLPDTINACGDEYVLSAPDGFSNYYWTNGDTSQATTLVQGFHEILLSVENENGCYGYHVYYVWIDPNPVVNLGLDSSYCASTVLDAENIESSYDWNTGETSQTITVTVTDVYSVIVTDWNNCSSTDSISIIINELPVINIADTIAGCAPHVVDAGEGFESYVWSTDEITQTITLESGDYSIFVSVTDSNNCSANHEFNAFIEGAPEALFDYSMIGVYDTIEFYANFMEGASYNWSFGDGSVDVGQVVTHTYGQGGVYNVQLIVETECGVDSIVEQIEITILGLSEIEEELNISIYPNPASNVLYIESNGAQLERFEIINYTGRQVLSANLNSNNIEIGQLPKSTYILIVYSKTGIAFRTPFIKM